MWLYSKPKYSCMRALNLMLSVKLFVLYIGVALRPTACRLGVSLYHAYVWKLLSFEFTSLLVSYVDCVNVWTPYTSFTTYVLWHCSERKSHHLHCRFHFVPSGRRIRWQRQRDSNRWRHNVVSPCRRYQRLQNCNLETVIMECNYYNCVIFDVLIVHKLY